MKYTYTYASHATLKNLACQMQVNKSNENYYLSNDTVMLLMTGGRISQIIRLEVQHKQNLAVMMAGSGVKSAQRKRLHYSASKLPCIDKGIKNASRK
jgi:hypothetical protein